MDTSLYTTPGNAYSIVYEPDPEPVYTTKAQQTAFLTTLRERAVSFQEAERQFDSIRQWVVKIPGEAVIAPLTREEYYRYLYCIGYTDKQLRDWVAMCGYLCNIISYYRSTPTADAPDYD